MGCSESGFEGHVKIAPKLTLAQERHTFVSEVSLGTSDTVDKAIVVTSP